jgi:hypothetical protein
MLSRSSTNAELEVRKAGMPPLGAPTTRLTVGIKLYHSRSPKLADFSNGSLAPLALGRGHARLPDLQTSIGIPAGF